MKITSIETVQIPKFPRHIWVMVHTDQGITGIGEGYDKPELTKVAIHNFCSEIILGQNPLNSEKLWNMMYDNANYTGFTGAEMRAMGAIDIALWDIKGKVAGMPVYNLLGGKNFDNLKIYNTCVSFGDIRDREMFLSDAGTLAESLLEEGISAMKIWPMDALSEKYNGQYVSSDAIRKGLEPFRKIREAVGDKMEIAFEGHSRWNIPMAARIAEELEQYSPIWFEDPILIDDPNNLKRLKDRINLPILASERLYTRFQFKYLMELDACDIVMFDIGYSGGITECKKIAAMAEAYRLPVSVHNCGSPLMTNVCANLLISCPNATLMETIRSHYKKFDMFDEGVDIRDGFINVNEKPGFGMEFRKEVLNAKDTVRVVTKSVKGDQMFAVTGDPWAQSPGDELAGKIEVKVEE
ncbi:MAG: mandelate racemase/muconate lactonizing enzyme family protein [Peptostreptococcaceae bacterium]|nr:mandelate racemase/muconate lactonizing enzyme family protein [Peptostreptococcaceae bacterium]